MRKYERTKQLRAYGAALSTTRHSPRRGGNGGSTREPAGRRGHRRVATRTAICAYANTRTRTHAVLCRTTCGARKRLAVPRTSLAVDPASKPESGISQTGNRPYIRSTRGKRVCVCHKRTNLPACGTRRNSKDRSDKVALYWSLARVTPLIIIAGLLFF